MQTPSLPRLFVGSPDSSTFGETLKLNSACSHDGHAAQLHGTLWAGKMVEAIHGCRRNLNVNGLQALDLQTHQADGTPWNFDDAADRQEASMLIAI